MCYLASMICAIIAILSRLKRKSIVDPAVLFATIWCVLSGLSCLQLYGLTIPNDMVYWIVIGGVVSFWGGSIISYYSSFRIKIDAEPQKEKVVRPLMLQSFTILFFVLMIVPSVRAIIFLSSGISLYTIRYSQLNDVIGGGTSAILFNYFCEPFLVFMIVYSVANLFSKDRSVKTTILTILGIFLMTICTGGRFFILYYIGALVVGYLLYRKRLFGKIEANVLKRVRLLALVGFVSILIVSSLRGAVVGQTAYIYSTGGLGFFEYLQTQFFDCDYTFGALTLNGFLRPFFVVFRKMGLGELPNFVENAENIFLMVDKPYFISSETPFNSFTTCFFAPFLDGGGMGVIVVFFVLGFLAEESYKNIQLDSTYKVSIYLLVALVVVLSFFRLLITHYSFALSFMYLLLCYERPNKEPNDGCIG